MHAIDRLTLWHAVADVAFPLVLLSIAAPLRAEMSVQTTDGRVLVGEIDTKSDADHLWIRREVERIVLTTAVKWNSIHSATVDGQPISVDEIASQLVEVVTDGPTAFLAWEDVPGEGTGLPVVAFRPLYAPPCVTNIEIDAVLVNRDRDVEPGGLKLVVAAIDAQGAAVPVRGSLYARLWCERDWPNGSVASFENLQRWSQPVAECDFADGVASYFLRFRTVRPAFDLTLHPDALINVRLSVYGAGNFEATIPVHLRRFEPFRDQLQLFEGRRYFREELTGAVPPRLQSY